MTRENARDWKTVFKKGIKFFPKPDNRHNEWSPLPSGIIMACFTTPVTIIFLVGTMLNIDPDAIPIYGVLTFIFGMWTLFAVADGSYIAGMRRVADQDLYYKDDAVSSRQRARPNFEPAEDLNVFDDRLKRTAEENEKATGNDSSSDSYS